MTSKNSCNVTYAANPCNRMRPPSLGAISHGDTQAMAADPGTVQGALAYAGIDPATASLITMGVYPTSLDAGRLQNVADLMFQSGMIARPVTVSAMIFN